MRPFAGICARFAGICARIAGTPVAWKIPKSQKSAKKNKSAQVCFYSVLRSQQLASRRCSGMGLHVCLLPRLQHGFQNLAPRLPRTPPSLYFRANCRSLQLEGPRLRGRSRSRTAIKRKARNPDTPNPSNIHMYRNLVEPLLSSLDVI